MLRRVLGVHGRLLAVTIGLCLAFAGPALAAKGKKAGDHGGDHAEATHASADDHGGGGHGEGDHGGAHHGPHYTGDADGDGTANWLDADADADVGEGTYVLPQIGFHVINLALLAGLVVWGAGGSIRDALRSRAVGIREDLDEAARLRDEAQARHDAVNARLGKLEQEIAALEAQAEQAAQSESAAIRQRADAAAARLAETVERQIADEARRARMALREEAVGLAVQLAEGILAKKVADEDDQRLAVEFLDTLNGGQEGSRV